MRVVSSEEFIRAWQTSESIREVIEKLKTEMTVSSMTSRASFLRKRGIPLKRMRNHGRKPLDIPALKDLAKSLENGQ